MADGHQSKSEILDAAWKRRTAALEELRRQVEATAHWEMAPEQRGRAYHQLMEMQALSYNFAIAPRMIHPRIFHNTAWQTDQYCCGGNGPDFHYGTVFLDGEQTYRLTVEMRDSKLVLAQHNSALPGSQGSRLVKNHDIGLNFQPGPDGRYEIILSADRHEGNWIELLREEPYQWLLFRPTVVGYDTEVAEIRIERISELDPDHYIAEDLDEAMVARRIDAATNYMKYVVDDWMVNFYPRTVTNAGGVNRLATIGPKISGEVGSPTAEYWLGGYEIEEDEALIIRTEKEPQGAYWGFQIFDVWLRTIDYRTRQTALSSAQIDLLPDGGVCVVISQKDVGLKNWIDTVRFNKGMLLLRNYRTNASANPTVERVKLKDLEAALPPGAARVTPEERQAALAARRAMFLRRHGE